MNEKIISHFNEHIKKAMEYCEMNNKRMLAIFYHGSANHGLETPDSDVDTFVVYAPSKKDILYNERNDNFNLTLENNEKITFQDIRNFMNDLYKGGFNVIEILQSKIFYFLDEDFISFYAKYKDDLCYLNPQSTAKSLMGMITSLYKKRPRIKEELLPKNSYFLLRFEHQLFSYLHGLSIEEYMYPKDIDFIKSIKIGEKKLDFSEKRFKEIERIYHKKVDTLKPTYKIDNCKEAIDMLLQRIIFKEGGFLTAIKKL